MGWGNCGTDSKGRAIGYFVEAKCDHPGCTETIDRGLSFVCGDMHGDDDVSCEGYFCSSHRHQFVENDSSVSETVTVCDACAKALLDSGEWHEDEVEGVIKPAREIEKP